MFAPHLRYFVALARERHFARAAQTCNVSQPTLSAAIRKLEELLEVPLVVRSHRFVDLTAEGHRVLGWAQQILTDYDSLKQELGALRNELSGVLRLGVIPAAMPSISHLTGPFCAMHPGVSVSVQSVNSRTIERGLDAFDFDGGITYLDNEPLNHVRRVPLYRERYVFIVRRDSPLAGGKTITWREAVQENLCLLSEDMQNRRIINELVRSLGLSVNPSVVSNSFVGVCTHVRQGGWASIVPNTFSYVFGNTGTLATVELVEPVHTQSVGLVVSDREPASPMTKALMACAATLDMERALDFGVQ